MISQAADSAAFVKGEDSTPDGRSKDGAALTAGTTLVQNALQPAHLMGYL